MNNINQQKVENSNVGANKKYWLNYTIEALKPISTEATVELANTMGKSIQQALLLNNMLVDFFVIGGIANNTHIELQKTVDILLLFKGYKNNDDDNLTPGNPGLDDIQLFRHNTEMYLKNKFPEAQFDNSLSLSLKLYNLPLSCDFCYYFGYRQTDKIQASGNSSQTKSIKLFNSKLSVFENLEPLSVTKRLMFKDKKTKGNAIPLIRILKNLKADAPSPISLTGHDITCIVYSMEDYTLTKQPGQIMFLLLEISLFLKALIEDPFLKRSLKGPDNSLLTKAKNDTLFIRGVYGLKNEVDLLIKNLIQEVDLYTNIYNYTIVQ